MKLVVAESGNVEVLDVPRPVCKPGEVLVKTAFSLISTGTESWTIDSTEPISTRDLAADSSRLKKAARLTSDVLKKEGVGGLVDYVKSVRTPRLPLGYSLSGVVVEVGKEVLDISVGDRIACAGEGKATHSEYACVPRNLLTVIPPQVDMKSASFVALGAIGVHAFRQGSAQVGDTVAVIGAGLVGNIVIQICKAAGCKVAAIDLQESRLEMARSSGVDLALSSGDGKLLDHIHHFSKGRGVDVVFVCASTMSSDPVNLASAIARDRGLVLIVGRVGMDFDRKLYYQKELDIRMSRSLGPGRYDPGYEEKGLDYPLSYVRWTLNRNMESFLELLARQSVKVDGLVEATFPVEEAAAAYDRVKSSGKVAVLLGYVETKAEEASTTSVLLETRKAGGRANVALVGPGGFARETLLPILRRDQDLNLKWVVASNPVHALEIAKRYHFEKYGTSLDDVLADSSVDAVIISTPNNLHYPMAVKVAKAGRWAFVEKPLCVKEEDLDDFVRSKTDIGPRIAVGFNRRYSRYVLKMRDVLKTLDGPFLLDYRVNADLAPLSRWSEDPIVGGGRVIHECCHFFDLFNFLLGSRSISASVSCVGVTGSTTVSKDSFVATVRYAEGSVANLTYSSLGNRSAPRERLEAFGQGTVMAIDDFKSLAVYPRTGRPVVTSSGVDKGHQAEFRELVRAMRGEPNSLIGFDETVAAMRDTFMVDRLMGAREDRGDNEKG